MTYVNITALTFPEGADAEIERRFAARARADGAPRGPAALPRAEEPAPAPGPASAPAPPTIPVPPSGPAASTRPAGRDGAAGDPADRGRAPRPSVAEGLPLQAYSDDQLDDMVAWIRSDGVQRDERAEVEELRTALSLTRRGTGIDAVLSNAVRRSR